MKIKLFETDNELDTNQNAISFFNQFNDIFRLGITLGNRYVSVRDKELQNAYWYMVIFSATKPNAIIEKVKKIYNEDIDRNWMNKDQPSDETLWEVESD